MFLYISLILAVLGLGVEMRGSSCSCTTHIRDHDWLALCSMFTNPSQLNCSLKSLKYPLPPLCFQVCRTCHPTLTSKCLSLCKNIAFRQAQVWSQYEFLVLIGVANDTTIKCYANLLETIVTSELIECFHEDPKEDLFTSSETCRNSSETDTNAIIDLGHWTTVIDPSCVDFRLLVLKNNCNEIFYPNGSSCPRAGQKNECWKWCTLCMSNISNALHRHMHKTNTPSHLQIYHKYANITSKHVQQKFIQLMTLELEEQKSTKYYYFKNANAKNKETTTTSQAKTTIAMKDRKWFLGFSQKQWADVLFVIPIVCVCCCIFGGAGCYFFCRGSTQKLDKFGKVKKETTQFGKADKKVASKIERGSKEKQDVSRNRRKEDKDDQSEDADEDEDPSSD